MKLIVYTDGASRGNPGPAAYGFVVNDARERILYEEGQAIGIATNNQAEYTAVLKALSYIRTRYPAGSYKVKVMTDSMLIAQQLAGRYKIKNINLRPLFDAIKGLEYELGAVSYQHIPRISNQRADRQANLALDRDRLRASQ